MSQSAPANGHPNDRRDAKPAGIDWLATTAGALAAVTSALLLSTLGAVGTLVGAALGSVAATIGTNLYSQALAKSREKVAKAQALTRLRSAGLAGVRQGSSPEPAPGPGDAAAADAEAVTGSEARSEPPPDEGETTTSTWRDRLRTLPWKRIGLLSLAMFLVVVAAITAFELLAGRSLSSIVGDDDEGRTTISGVTGGSERRDQKPGDDPSTGATETPEPSSTPSDDPTEEPEQEPADPDEAEETDEPSATPTAEPSAEPLEQPSDGAGPLTETSPSSAP